MIPNLELKYVKYRITTVMFYVKVFLFHLIKIELIFQTPSNNYTIEILIVLVVGLESY